MKFLTLKQTRKILGAKTLTRKDITLVEDNQKLFLVSKDILQCNLDPLAVRKVGLCIGELKHNQLHFNEAATPFFQ